ncbi:MAG: M23 family metallopeptidase [Spirochaetaceae bacterium]|nr:M23 family metallopeptidase [Spirochaetaceae bacterium]
MGKRGFVLSAVVAACLLLVVGAMARAVSPEPPPAATPGTAAIGHRPDDRMRLRRAMAAAAALRPEALDGLSAGEAKARARALAGRAEAAGLDPVATIDRALPGKDWVQARLVMRRDEENLRLDAAADNAYGRSYAAIRASLSGTRATAEAVEAAVGELWRRYADQASDPRLVSPLARGDRWIPGTRALRASHQYALDIFFTSLSRDGAEEKGPTVVSMSRGVVVSAAGDWVGGDRPSAYVSGGLSPKAGNGVVVFDPSTGRYYAYFHLSDVAVRAGQLVEPGRELGRGGNTGVNARRRGHGGHLHLEIHESDGTALSAFELRDLIASIR